MAYFTCARSISNSITEVRNRTKSWKAHRLSSAEWLEAIRGLEFSEE
jgi:hypothetical protein